MRNSTIDKFFATYSGFVRGVISGDKPEVKAKLQDIIQPRSEIGDKYNLSKRACEGIIVRAARRGKTLPKHLEYAIKAVADVPVETPQEDCLGAGVARLRGFGDYVMDEISSTTKAADYKGHTDLIIDTSPAVTSKWAKGSGGPSGDECQNLVCAVETGHGYWMESEVTGTLRADCSGGTGASSLITMPFVRRLTPVECERLQGFPDDWTRVPYNGKMPEKCSDTPRYKACGNSFAVPVIRFIGQRISQVDSSHQ